MTNIKEKILEYGGGSISAAARRMDVTPGYLSGVANCKRPASKLVREALGLVMRRTVIIEYFERVPAQEAETDRAECYIVGCDKPMPHEHDWSGPEVSAIPINTP